MPTILECSIKPTRRKKKQQQKLETILGFKDPSSPFIQDKFNKIHLTYPSAM